MPKLTLRQILFDGSDVAGSPTELFYVIAPLLGCGAYSAPLAWGPSNVAQPLLGGRLPMIQALAGCCHGWRSFWSFSKFSRSNVKHGFSSTQKCWMSLWLTWDSLTVNFLNQINWIIVIKYNMPCPVSLETLLHVPAHANSIQLNHRIKHSK